MSKLLFLLFVITPSYKHDALFNLFYFLLDLINLRLHLQQLLLVGLNWLLHLFNLVISLFVWTWESLNLFDLLGDSFKLHIDQFLLRLCFFNFSILCLDSYLNLLILLFKVTEVILDIDHLCLELLNLHSDLLFLLIWKLLNNLACHESLLWSTTATDHSHHLNDLTSESNNSVPTFIWLIKRDLVCLHNILCNESVL